MNKTRNMCLQNTSNYLTTSSMFGMFAPAMEYMVDAAQRRVLFWDVMRQRGNQYREHLAETAPHVLDYRGGACHRRPYARAAGQLCAWCGSFRRRASRSIRSAGRSSLSTRAPGMALALAASRPTAKSALRSKPGIPAISSASCPIPCRARRIEDIARAEAVFLEKVIALHPGRRRQAVRHRQLPGRMGDHDARRHPSRAVRAHHHRRARRSPIGPACAARIRCATAAACWAAAG